MSCRAARPRHTSPHQADPRTLTLSESRSLTGGIVYGPRFPEVRGAYIYGDYASGRLWGLKYENGKLLTNQLLMRQDCNPSSFGEDKDGELYLCEYGRGIIWKIVGE